MHSGTAMHVDFWEAVLARLGIFMAKAYLKEIHTKMLHKNLQCLVQREAGNNKLNKAVHDLQPEEEESKPDANDLAWQVGEDFRVKTQGSLLRKNIDKIPLVKCPVLVMHVTSVSYHPKDNCMISSSVDGNIKVWKS